MIDWDASAQRGRDKTERHLTEFSFRPKRTAKQKATPTQASINVSRAPVSDAKQQAQKSAR